MRFNAHGRGISGKKDKNENIKKDILDNKPVARNKRP
jgi:hypothetical protein